MSFVIPSRREWLDVLIALVEYLRSGTCRVGFLNSVAWNMLHKDQEGSLRGEEEESAKDGGCHQYVAGDTSTIYLVIVEISVLLRRSKREREVITRRTEMSRLGNDNSGS